MTAPPQKTARQTFGEVFTFLREQRQLSQARVADMVKASTGDVANWEAGREVPNGQQWELLKKMVNGAFARYGGERQKALTEMAAEREMIRSTLSQRPFAAALTPKPEPVAPPPEPVVTEEPVPTTLTGDDFDLVPAYVASRNLPAGWRTADAIEERLAFARPLIAEGLTNTEIVQRVREEFGVGIGVPTLTQMREEHMANRVETAVEYARMLFRKMWSAKDAEMNALLVQRFNLELPVEKLAELREEARKMRVSGQVPVVTPPAPVPVAPTTTINDNDLEGAVRLILETIPNLRSFTIVVSDAGEVTVNHTTREVRVVESTGSLKIKK